MNGSTIENLLYYASKRLGLKEVDVLYVRNLILREYGFASPLEGEADKDYVDSLLLPDELLVPFVEYGQNELGLSFKQAEEKAIYCMGLASPRPSQVDEEFQRLYAKGPQQATEYLYRLAIDSYYVMKSKIDQNILFQAYYEDGPSLDISINLSKPEKSNKDIAKLVGAKASGYPSCMLCKENIGYEGNDKIPARGTLRFASVPFGDETWYVQYSPYGYFDHHIIVFSSKHAPMVVNRKSMDHLLSFVERFPHMFLGSNADLPIVGGSILNHEHFQGGQAKLPLLRAPMKYEIPMEKAKSTKLFRVDFYNTALLLRGPDKEEILDIAEKIRTVWGSYDDLERDIVSIDENGRHSTLTPIAKKDGDDYLLYLLLRNNRCNETYPDGIFHAHPEYFPIKKEGIGLIEAAGLFILPARLVRQEAELEAYVKDGLSNEEIAKVNPEYADFGDFASALRNGQSKEKYLGEVCRHILWNTAVFKPDEKGEEGLSIFIRRCQL